MSNLKGRIATRVPKTVEKAYDVLAEKRHLKAADIVREALREYLERRGVLAANGNGEKQEVAA